MVFYLVRSLGCPSKAGGEYEHCISVYRFTRLFNDVHNIVFGSIFLPISKFGTLLVRCMTACCIVRLRDSLSPIIYAFFLFYFFFLAIIILPGAVLMFQVYQISKTFQRNVMKIFENSHVEGDACPEERKLFQMTLRSMPVLTVEVGGFYQMERQAKLTLADNMARGVAFGLLTF